MKIKIISIILLILPIYTKLSAQIITDRPDQTESASTVPKGSLQLESGASVNYQGDNKISVKQILLPTNLFRYGITKIIEIRVLNQFEDIKYDKQSSQGISDMELGAKIQIIKNENANIAFLTHFIFPTGTKELTSDKFGSSNKISISHELNEVLGIGYNLGYNYFGEGNGDFTYSLALGLGINKKVGIYAETYGEITNLEKFISNFDAGFTYLTDKDLQIDFSFGTGINQRMNYISIGFSWLMMKE